MSARQPPRKSRSDSQRPGQRPRRTAQRPQQRPARRQGAGAPRELAISGRSALPAVLLRAAVWHPLIYRKRVARVDQQARPGDLVAVYVEPDQLLGYGLYNPRSEIAVRMVRFGEEIPDDEFWNGKLASAIQLRRQLLRLDDVTDAYRVLHAEADGFTGLVVDRFGDVLSAEVFSLGMFQRVAEILDRLAPRLGTKHTLIQPGPQVLAQEGFDSPPLSSTDCPASVLIHEFETRFRVHFEGGHKTGFFCDQRDNRRQLAQYCAGKSVLDLCCYTGGFAIQAKRLGSAAEVIGVDLDEGPLEIARENANLNQVRVRFVQADVFPFMRDMIRGGKQFDVVVLDPPKLVRSRAELDEGTRKHFDLNRLAMQLVAPGGLLLSCSCAGLLSSDEFLKLLLAAARQAGAPLSDDESGFSRRGIRGLQILAKTGAAADHPVDSTCPESEYLKAVWMRLE